ncbi:hypothetical protein D3C71_20170 [compost metagenome]
MLKSTHLLAAGALAFATFAAHAETPAAAPTPTSTVKTSPAEAAPAPEGKLRMPRPFPEAQEPGQTGPGHRLFELRKQIDQNVEKLASPEVQGDKAETVRLKDETIGQLLELHRLRKDVREQMATRRARVDEAGHEARTPPSFMRKPAAPDASAATDPSPPTR